MTWHGPWNQSLQLHRFDHQATEKENFDEAQKQATADLAVLLKNCGRAIQIGGGHDHIFPYLKALSTIHKKIVCLNIDAHCDTRTDLTCHSGTPFRQFGELGVAEFELWQIGIHAFANSASTLTEVKDTTVRHFPVPLPQSFWTDLKNLLLNLEPDTCLVFSLDLDALESGTMEGVSAVNHFGLTATEVMQMLEMVLVRNKPETYFGFYEYNPIYDNLSQKGARFIASLIYKILAHSQTK